MNEKKIILVGWIVAVLGVFSIWSVGALDVPKVMEEIKEGFAVSAVENVTVENVDVKFFRVEVTGHCNGNYESPEIMDIKAKADRPKNEGNVLLKKFSGKPVGTPSVTVNPDGSKTLTTDVLVVYLVQEHRNYILLKYTINHPGALVVKLFATIPNDAK